MVNETLILALIQQIKGEKLMSEEQKELLLNLWLRTGYLIVGMTFAGDGKGLIDFDHYINNLTKMKLLELVGESNKRGDNDPIH